MLTRIEIDGFKNLLGFSAEFGPFTCIAGPNAVGKSNLFDAIEFLSLLAEHPLEDAAERVRATAGVIESARRLFWTNGRAHTDTITLAAEMVVPPGVIDDLGVPAQPDDVCMRYEVVLRWDNGLRLTSERLTTLGRPLGEHLRFPHSPAYVARFGSMPDTVPPPRVIYDVQRGQLPGGRQAQFDTNKARATVLSQYRTADHPALLAASRELSSWRNLALEPAALRTPDKLGSHAEFDARGHHLPAQLRRLIERGAVDDEDHLSAMLTMRVGSVTNLRRVWVYEDQNSGLMTLRATARSGEELSAGQISDGTLRYLALALLDLDPRPGVFCIEEPENGVHPRLFGDLYEMLKSIASDLPDAEVDLDEPAPLRQVLVNTHSSRLVGEVYQHSPEDLLMATSVFIQHSLGDARVLALNPILGTWRCTGNTRGVNLPVVDYVGAAARPWQLAGVAEDK